MYAAALSGKFYFILNGFDSGASINVVTRFLHFLTGREVPVKPMKIFLSIGERPFAQSETMLNISSFASNITINMSGTEIYPGGAKHILTQWLGLLF